MANISDPLDINMLQGGASATAADSVGQEFVPEVWGQAILDKFRTNTVMLPLANDLSSEAKGTDKIHLPHIGVTPLGDVAQGTPIASDVATGGSMAATETALNIDQHKVTSLWIPHALKAQSSYNIFNMYSDQLAYAIGRGVDNYLMYKIVDNLTTAHGSSTGATQDTVDMLEVGDAISSSNIDDIFKEVILEKGSTEGWTKVLSPTLYASLAALDSAAGFVRGTAGPLGADFASTGVAGNILGMNVVVTQSPYLDVGSVSADADKGVTVWDGFDTNDGTNDDILRGFCMHNSALYYAAAQSPRVQQSYQHTELSDLITVDAIYGCAVRNSATAGDRRIIGLSKNV